jgi:hypothetical protein
LVARIAFPYEKSIEQFLQMQSRQVNNMTAKAACSASIGITARVAVAGSITRIAIGIATGDTETFEEVAERNLRQATSATGVIARLAVVSNIARIALASVVAGIAFVGTAMSCCKETTQPFAEFKFRQAGVVASDFAARVNVRGIITRIARHDTVAGVAVANRMDAFY